jgi:Fe-S cluster biogenesis protein NfuA
MNDFIILPIRLHILGTMKNILSLVNCLAAFATIEAFTPHSHSPLSLSRTIKHSALTHRSPKEQTSVRRNRHALHQSTNSEEFAKAPTFNGQLILPIKVIMNGLKGHKVAAVYAVQSEKQNGWGAVKHVSITKDLYGDLDAMIEEFGSQIAFVRALSFAYPQKTAMTEVAQRWAGMVAEEGGSFGFRTVEEQEELVNLMLETADYDDDDDDDEFEYDDEDNVPLFVDQTQKVAVSESQEGESSDGDVTSPFEMPTYSSTSDEKLEFNAETVDKVLDEIRPYLISDGGNVSVHNVDEKTRSVYLVLEGACGSCASSTVTMQMGIERILKENFENMGEVAQVTPDEPGDDDVNATELTMDAVMKEVNRISPAITAMGGVVEVLSVDPIGVVEISFRGANKVKQGLELALRDVKYVKHVKFVS